MKPDVCPKVLTRAAANVPAGPEAQRQELRELAEIYRDRGLSPRLAQQVAEELTQKDVIRAHARDELVRLGARCLFFPYPLAAPHRSLLL